MSKFNSIESRLSMFNKFADFIEAFGTRYEERTNKKQRQ